MLRLRLTRRCFACHRRLWFWQGQRTVQTCSVGDRVIWDSPRIVCSDRCELWLYFNVGKEQRKL